MPNVKDKALTLEDLKEALVQTGNALPAISSSDEGKIMRVDSNGNWNAEELPLYSGESGGGESNTLTSDFLKVCILGLRLSFILSSRSRPLE